MAAQNRNAVATIDSAAIAEGTTFSVKQVELISEQIMPGASEDDLMLFAQVASSRGLDPFRKHIYAVSRRTKVGNDWVEKWSYQVSIDGLRLIAERSGLYEGQTLPLWCGPDGQWREVWLDNEPPAAAKVGVYKKGTREPIYAIALYRTFVQKTSKGEITKFWRDMPEHMLAKVAESQALRKAFPEEAGGLYTGDEMAQASNPAPPPEAIDRETGEIIDVQARPAPTTARVEPLDPELKQQKKRLWDLSNGQWGWTKAQLNAVSVNTTGTALEDHDADGIKSLYMDLVGASEDERAELIAGLAEAS